MYLTENDLWAILLPLVRAAVANMEGETPRVVRAFTPDVQHNEGTPRVALHRVASRRYGAQGTEQDWRVDAAGNGRMIETSVWRKEDTYRIYAYAERAPEDDGYTAKDLLEAVAAFFQGRQGLEALRAEGIGILRVTDITETPFLNDQERHEFGHHIDCILTYRQERERAIPVATTIERKVYRV